jgi:hypothetical protein
MQMGVSQSNRRSISNARQIRSYAELQEQLHRDLLTQHPEWIDSDGNCPRCDEYDRRLAELIAIFQSVNDQSMNKTAKATMNGAIAA